MLVNVVRHDGIHVAHSACTKLDGTILGGVETLDIAIVDVNPDVAGGGVEVAMAAAARGLYVIIIAGNDGVAERPRRTRFAAEAVLD
jgi:predicted transcriptional regulator